VDDDERVVEEFGGHLVSVYRGDPGVAELRGVVEGLEQTQGLPASRESSEER
jgi:hypothetical protein